MIENGLFRFMEVLAKIIIFLPALKSGHRLENRIDNYSEESSKFE